MTKRISSIFLCLLMLIGFISCDDKAPLTQTVTATPIGIVDLTVNSAPETTAGIVTLPSGEVKVMSINVYLNDSLRHAPGMIKLISEADPDTIGVQEFMDGWNASFETGLSDYAFVGYNMNGLQNKYCEGNYIFYKKDKYVCLEWDTFWLTDDPYHSSGNPEVDNKRRNCTWALFEDIETGFRFAHVNCHLESASDEVNLRQMPMVRDMMLRFAALGIPVFGTGDFNAREGGDTYAIMVTDTGIADTKFIAEDSMNKGSHHGLGEYKESTGLPIDFCFTAEDLVDVSKYEIIETWIDGMFVSDHNIVMSTSTIKPLPDQYSLVPELSTDGITAELVSNRPYVADVRFTQANDVLHVTAYRVWAEDAEGNEIVCREIPSFCIDKNRPSELMCTLTGLSPATDYTVYIAPMTIIGTYGSTVSFELTTPEAE